MRILSPDLGRTYSNLHGILNLPWVPERLPRSQEESLGGGGREGAGIHLYN